MPSLTYTFQEQEPVRFTPCVGSGPPCRGSSGRGRRHHPRAAVSRVTVRRSDETSPGVKNRPALTREFVGRSRGGHAVLLDLLDFCGSSARQPRFAQAPSGYHALWSHVRAVQVGRHTPRRGKTSTEASAAGCPVPADLLHRVGVDVLQMTGLSAIGAA